jgi:hypothetical protein
LEGNHDLHKKPCNKQIAKKQWMTQKNKKTKKQQWHNGSAPLNDIHKDDKY